MQGHNHIEESAFALEKIKTIHQIYKILFVGSYSMEKF